MDEAVTWMRDGLCREPEYAELPWFPPRGHTPAVLKEICGRCVVRDECLAYAQSHGIDHGIWGGLSPRERHSESTTRADTPHPSDDPRRGGEPRPGDQPTPPTSRLAG